MKEERTGPADRFNHTTRLWFLYQFFFRGSMVRILIVLHLWCHSWYIPRTVVIFVHIHAARTTIYRFAHEKGIANVIKALEVEVFTRHRTSVILWRENFRCRRPTLIVLTCKRCEHWTHLRFLAGLFHTNSIVTSASLCVNCQVLVDNKLLSSLCLLLLLIKLLHLLIMLWLRVRL